MAIIPKNYRAYLLAKLRLVTPREVTFGTALIQAALTANFTLEYFSGKGEVDPWAGVGMIVLVGFLYFLPMNKLRHQQRMNGWDLAFLVLFTLENMVMILLSFAGIYSANGIISNYRVGLDGKIDNIPMITHDRGECFYFSAITWTTVGYGDFLPTPGACQFAAATEALLEYVFLGTFIVVALEISKDMRRPTPPLKQN